MRTVSLALAISFVAYSAHILPTLLSLPARHLLRGVIVSYAQWGFKLRCHDLALRLVKINLTCSVNMTKLRIRQTSSLHITGPKNINHAPVSTSTWLSTSAMDTTITALCQLKWSIPDVTVSIVKSTDWPADVLSMSHNTAWTTYKVTVYSAELASTQPFLTPIYPPIELHVLYAFRLQCSRASQNTGYHAASVKKSCQQAR